MNPQQEQQIIELLKTQNELMKKMLEQLRNCAECLAQIASNPT